MGMQPTIAYQSLGYVQYASGKFSSAAFLKNVAPSSGDFVAAGIPDATTDIVVYVEGATLRWTDGPGASATAPTASVGNPVAAGAAVTFNNNFPQIQFFQNTGCILNITYYRRL